MKKQQSGFTLIEIMITVTIIGILASIAYPSYQESVRKSKRAEGRSALLEMMQQQERYMTQYNQYLAIASGASNYSSITSASDKIKNYSGENFQKAAWRIKATACKDQSINDCVELTAYPGYTESDNNRAITAMSLTSSGRKSCAGTKTDLCWK